MPTPADATTTLEPLDWGVFAAYLLVLVVIGAIASRGGGAADYFLGGRRMPVWAVALSVLATATSAATFIGGPEEAYVRDLTYLSTSIGTALAVVVVALVFIPAFYRHNVTTVYDLLEGRFGRATKVASSWMFMIGRVFASGSRIYVAALPASIILFGDIEPMHLFVAIAVICAAGIATAFGGGIRGVIWTDVLQFIVFVVAAASALAVLLSRIPLGVGEIYETLRATEVGGASKLTVLRVGIDPGAEGLGFDAGAPYTLLTAIFGFSLLNLAAYGTDHDLTQRMLTCRSALRGSSSALLALVLNLPVLAVFMSIGLLLHILYRRPDLMGQAWPGPPPDQSAEVFLRFITDQMPAGLVGLMMAGLFAVGVGSLNSAIAAMSATFVNDAYRPLAPGRSDRHYVWVGRAAVVGWGVALGLFAALCVRWSAGSAQTLIGFVLGAMTFAYAGLLGVFLTALCTRRGRGWSAIAALVAGFVVVFFLQPAGEMQRVWGIGAVHGSMHRAVRVISGWDASAFVVAFPWRLTIATAVSFAICCLGRPMERPRSAGADDGG